jgi:hypothetical protein
MSSKSFAALADIANDIREVVVKSGIKNKPITIAEVTCKINRALAAFVEDYDERRLYERYETNVKNLPPLTNIERDIADMLMAVLEAAKDFGVDIAYAVETKCEYDKMKIKDHE